MRYELLVHLHALFALSVLNLQSLKDESRSIQSEFLRTAIDRVIMVQSGLDSYMNGALIVFFGSITASLRKSPCPELRRALPHRPNASRFQHVKRLPTRRIPGVGRISVCGSCIQRLLCKPCFTLRGLCALWLLPAFLCAYHDVSQLLVWCMVLRFHAPSGIV